MADVFTGDTALYFGVLDEITVSSITDDNGLHQPFPNALSLPSVGNTRSRLFSSCFSNFLVFSGCVLDSFWLTLHITANPDDDLTLQNKLVSGPEIRLKTISDVLPTYKFAVIPEFGELFFTSWLYAIKPGNWLRMGLRARSHGTPGASTLEDGNLFGCLTDGSGLKRSYPRLVDATRMPTGIMVPMPVILTSEIVDPIEVKVINDPTDPVPIRGVANAQPVPTALTGQPISVTATNTSFGISGQPVNVNIEDVAGPIEVSLHDSQIDIPVDITNTSLAVISGATPLNVAIPDQPLSVTATNTSFGISGQPVNVNISSQSGLLDVNIENEELEVTFDTPVPVTAPTALSVVVSNEASASIPVSVQNDITITNTDFDVAVTGQPLSVNATIVGQPVSVTATNTSFGVSGQPLDVKVADQVDALHVIIDNTPLDTNIVNDETAAIPVSLHNSEITLPVSIADPVHAVVDNSSLSVVSGATPLNVTATNTSFGISGQPVNVNISSQTGALDVDIQNEELNVVFDTPVAVTASTPLPVTIANEPEAPIPVAVQNDVTITNESFDVAITGQPISVTATNTSFGISGQPISVSGTVDANATVIGQPLSVTVDNTTPIAVALDMEIPPTVIIGNEMPIEMNIANTPGVTVTNEIEATITGQSAPLEVDIINTNVPVEVGNTVDVNVENTAVAVNATIVGQPVQVTVENEPEEPVPVTIIP